MIEIINEGAGAGIDFMHGSTIAIPGVQVLEPVIREEVESLTSEAINDIAEAVEKVKQAQAG